MEQLMDAPDLHALLLEDVTLDWTAGILQMGSMVPRHVNRLGEVEAIVELALVPEHAFPREALQAECQIVG